MPKEPQPLNYEAIPVFPYRLVILNEHGILLDDWKVLQKGILQKFQKITFSFLRPGHRAVEPRGKRFRFNSTLCSN